MSTYINTFFGRGQHLDGYHLKCYAMDQANIWMSNHNIVAKDVRAAWDGVEGSQTVTIVFDCEDDRITKVVFKLSELGSVRAVMEQSNALLKQIGNDNIISEGWIDKDYYMLYLND